MTINAASYYWPILVLPIVLMAGGCGPSGPNCDTEEVHAAWTELLDAELDPLRAEGRVPSKAEVPITFIKHNWDQGRVSVIFGDGAERPRMVGAAEMRIVSEEPLQWELVRYVLAAAVDEIDDAGEEGDAVAEEGDAVAEEGDAVAEEGDTGAGEEEAAVRVLRTVGYTEDAQDSKVDVTARLDRYLMSIGLERRKLLVERDIALPENLLEGIEPTATIERFAKWSRLTGSHGCNAAADYIVERLKGIEGIASVNEHTFEVPVPNDRGGSISLPADAQSEGELEFAIHSIWPNLARTSKTLAEGSQGHLLYGANGQPAGLNGLELEGCIVLMDFNCREGWLTLAQFGARAIVFIEPDETSRKEAQDKFLQIPANIARYYITRVELAKMLSAVLKQPVSPDDLPAALAQINKLPPVEVTLCSDVLWEKATGRNIVATIPGSDPKLRHETIVIESFYDSISVVPALAPGAESACGIAALLEIAEAFAANPPGRTVRILATSGHFQALAGIRHWCRDYHVWETLAVKPGIGLDNELYVPPKPVWPPPNDSGDEAATPPAWKPAEYPVIYACIDLSSRSDQVGVFYKGHFYDIGGEVDETVYRKRFSELGNMVLNTAQDMRSMYGISTEFVSCIDPKRGRKWRSYIPGQIALNNEVPMMYGKPAIGLVTVNDGRLLVDTPLDTPHSPSGGARVKFENVRRQAKLLAATLWDISSRDFEMPECQDRALEAYVGITEDSLINFLPGSPIPDALLALETHTSKALMGVRGMAMAMTDQQGRCLTVGLDGAKQEKNIAYIPFKIDRRDGSIEYVNKKGLVTPRAPAITGPSWEQTRFEKGLDANVQVFECSGTLIFDLMDWSYYRSMTQAVVLDSDSNSEPRNFAYFIGQSSGASSYSEPCGVVFIERGESNVKIIVQSGPTGAKFTLINSQSNESLELAQGIGFPAVERENAIYCTTYRAATDMWKLDDYRLTRLKSTGVRNERASYLHGIAKKALDKSEAALAERDYSTFLSKTREGWAYEARAYPNVRSTADDVIKGLIFYLAVLLPFAVFGERLLFAFSDIRKRLLGITGLFFLIYIVLSLVHPGFKLATTPIIILTGFFMMVLGAVTIGILLSKFNTQMALMREKTGTWHRQDVNRSSAAGAAFMLGISNLRRRKTRTLLTCITIVLLTFTVLSFTSFETSVAPNEIPTNYDSTYSGVLIRRRDWSSFEKYATSELKGDFRNRGGVVAERTWISSKPDSQEYLSIQVTRVGNGVRPALARGMLGLDPAERHLTQPQKLLLGNSEWFDPASPMQKAHYPNVCILPRSMAEGENSLEIGQEDVGTARVLLQGRELVVVGIIDDDRFKQLKDLDGEELTPVDYITQSQNEASAGQKPSYTVTATDQLEEVEELKPPELYAHMSPAAVVIVPNEFIQSYFDATVRSVAVGMVAADSDTLTALLREYVPRMKLILFAGIGDKVKLFSSRDALTAKGMKALFLPIAIASLIVFNTMLGSVYERLREIAVYTSCGLAPVHVAALFFAESSVFATMGAVIGYLLGQGVAKIVTETGQLAGINLNYSSVSAVYSIILVIGVVLLSTAYPARKAVQLSVPDESKKMKLPRPQGDLWEFDFPFTVSSTEARGLNAFIYDYFDSHKEDSGGVFCADSLRFLSRGSGEEITHVIDSTVWVEPMDMGISQKVVLETVPPSEEDRICTIKFTIRRLSGEVETWRRMNLGFLKAIRKQMLIWRLVDTEHKQEFDQQGQDLLKKSAEV